MIEYRDLTESILLQEEALILGEEFDYDDWQIFGTNSNINYVL